MTNQCNRNSGASLASSTLIEVLRWRAAQQHELRAFTFLADAEAKESNISYGELDRKARAIGAWLQSLGEESERVLLLHPPGLEYIAALMGCFYAGFVAVPAYPPRPNRALARLQTMVADSRAKIALTTAATLSKIDPIFRQAPELKFLKWEATDSLPAGLEDHWHESLINDDTFALLQYTSGSTGSPKGIMLSHGNLLHNSALIQRAFGHDSASVGVSWLPTHHDMGLIGGILQPLYVGFPCTLMSPFSFLQRPLRWLRAISDYKATTSGGPNFAYELCVQRTTPEQRAMLDLSSWRIAFNGAEPIRAETMTRFIEAFASCAFHPEAVYPCYGLAEATLIVSGGLKKKTLLQFPSVLDRKTVDQDRSMPSPIQHKCVRTWTSSGEVLPGQNVVIVHPETMTHSLPGEIGEVWISGLSVAQGYWNRPDETERVFHAHLSDTGEGPFLRTGDLGFIRDGELYITGRLKEMIIIRGCNHYALDIEWTAERSYPSLLPGCCAAFSIEVNGDEQLVIVQEVDCKSSLPKLTDLIGTIRQAVAEQHQISVYEVALVKFNSIPRTTSGKIQRHACKAEFLAGRLDLLNMPNRDAKNGKNE